jgi:DNA-binding LacI/PurR family transcriptional regulator
LVPGAASSETAQRIFDAAKDLNYVPNAQAAGLRKQSSKVVGLIVADISNPFFAAIAVGLEQRLLEAGYGLLVANTGNRLDLERRYVQTMAQNRVEALVVAPTSNEGAHLEEARRLGIRLVLMDTRISGLDVDYVLVDDEAAIFRAITHLIDTGHERIAYISGHQKILSDLDRLKGRAAALAAANVKDYPDLVVRGDFTEAGGYQAAARLFSLREPPTAIVASNNFMTMGVLRYALAAGIKIPEELSIISFDDMDWFDIVKPSISAIRQPVTEIGALIGELVAEGARSDHGVTYVLPTTMTLRDSSAPLNSRIRA